MGAPDALALGHRVIAVILAAVGIALTAYLLATGVYVIGQLIWDFIKVVILGREG